MKQIYSISPRISVLYSVLTGLRSRLVSAIVLLGLLLPTSLLHADVDYFCFTAVEAGAVITITRGGTTTLTPVYEKSTDNGLTWSSISLTSSSNNVCTLSNVGDNVLIRGTNTTSKGIGHQNSSGYGRWKFGATKKVKVSGNIMSLIDYRTEITVIPNAYCFCCLFEDCKAKLVSAEDLVLPATELKAACYEQLFFNCSIMTSPPRDLPALTLADNCYNQMFSGCSKLTSTPAMPATSLAEGCYLKMFWKCAALTTAPALPVTTLATQCYNMMFAACTGLTTAPELPATTLAPSCYINMFNGCTALTTAPELPATTLATDCYNGMFSGCTSLVNVPDELPATTLVARCYKNMFQGCTALVNAPVIMASSLPANTTANAGCMEYMFQHCTGLRRLEVRFTAWDTNNAHDNTKNATYGWLIGTTKNSSCKFICSCDLPDTDRGDNRIQTYWTRSTIYTYIFDVVTNGGTWAVSDNEEMTHERISNDVSTNIVTLPTAQKTGYVFTGWNTAIDGSGTTLTIDNQTDYTCSNTFYAQFAAQVTFNVNGGTWDGSDADDRVETLPVGSVSHPVRDGYNFTGWNTAIDGTGVDWDIDNQPSTPTTYYAQWEWIVPTMLELYDNTDNTTLLTDNIGSTLDVSFVNRTLVGGTLNTLCLPFSLTAEQVGESVLAGSTVYAFDNATLNDDILSVNMTPTDAIAAGVPYLIEPLTDIVNPTFSGVTITTASGSASGDSQVSFVGIMVPTVLTAGRQDQLFLTAGNALQRPSVTNALRVPCLLPH